MLTTAPALFTLEIPGQLDLFDQITAQEETTVTETPEFTYPAVGTRVSTLRFGEPVTGKVIGIDEREQALYIRPAGYPALQEFSAHPLGVTVLSDETPAARKAPARRTADHRTFVAKLTNGDIATRSSKTMDYSHAVEITTPGSGTFIISWHKSVAAAQKQADRYRGGTPDFPVVTGVRVRLVAALPYNSAEAKAARAQDKADMAARLEERANRPS